MRALVTGFEGWAGRVNPSGMIAKSLEGLELGDDFEVNGRELPEDFYKLPKLLEGLIRTLKPDVVIGTGWDYISKVKVEKVALNIQNSVFGESIVPDNYNHRPEGEQVVKQGELALRTTLPAELIVKRLKSQKIPAFVSYQAGTHCCNTVMYSAIYYARRRKNILSGFIHIPPVSEMKVEKSGTKPMKLDQERKAIEIALKACRDYVNNKNNIS